MSNYTTKEALLATREIVAKARYDEDVEGAGISAGKVLELIDEILALREERAAAFERAKERSCEEAATWVLPEHRADLRRAIRALRDKVTL
jgi:hypothetical protein